MRQATNYTAWLIMRELDGSDEHQYESAFAEVVKSRNEALRATHIVIVFDLILMLYIGLFVVLGKSEAGSEVVKLEYNEHVGFVLFLLGNLFFAVEMGNFFRVIIAEKLIYEIARFCPKTVTFKRIFYLHFSSVAAELRRRLPMADKDASTMQSMNIYCQVIPMLALNLVLYCILIVFLIDLLNGGDYLCEAKILPRTVVFLKDCAVPESQCIHFNSPLWLRETYAVILLALHSASAFFSARFLLEDISADGVGPTI